METSPQNTEPRLSDWVDALPAGGCYTFTRADAEAASGASFIAVQSALRRLKQKGRIVAPRRGFYIWVPPEFRAIGAPPASWFIDDLMAFCGCTYYVALLSAAALHGAAHQQPMVFQVLTNGFAGRMRAGRVTIEARTSRTVGQVPTTQVQTETGTMVVSSPEATALDLVRFPQAAGHWNHIATVLTELADAMDPDRLAAVAQIGKVPDLQRLGYLLNLIGAKHLAAPLAQSLSGGRVTAVALRTDRPTAGFPVDARWQLIINEAVEPDL